MSPDKKQARRKIIAEKLRQARIETGLNQAQAAKLLGRPQSFISRAEKGLQRIDVVELEEFARIYEKRLSFFLNTEHQGGNNAG